MAVKHQVRTPVRRWSRMPAPLPLTRGTEDDFRPLCRRLAARERDGSGTERVPRP
jgi:hypothetical protein